MSFSRLLCGVWALAILPGLDTSGAGFTLGRVKAPATGLKAGPDSGATSGRPLNLPEVSTDDVNQSLLPSLQSLGPIIKGADDIPSEDDGLLSEWIDVIKRVKSGDKITLDALPARLLQQLNSSSSEESQLIDFFGGSFVWWEQVKDLGLMSAHNLTPIMPPEPIPTLQDLGCTSTVSPKISIHVTETLYCYATVFRLFRGRIHDHVASATWLLTYLSHVLAPAKSETGETIPLLVCGVRDRLSDRFAFLGPQVEALHLQVLQDVEFLWEGAYPSLCALSDVLSMLQNSHENLIVSEQSASCTMGKGPWNSELTSDMLLRAALKLQFFTSWRKESDGLAMRECVKAISDLRQPRSTTQSDSLEDRKVAIQPLDTSISQEPLEVAGGILGDKDSDQVNSRSEETGVSPNEELPAIEAQDISSESGIDESVSDEGNDLAKILHKTRSKSNEDDSLDEMWTGYESFGEDGEDGIEEIDPDDPDKPTNPQEKLPGSLRDTVTNEDDIPEDIKQLWMNRDKKYGSDYMAQACKKLGDDGNSIARDVEDLDGRSKRSLSPKSRSIAANAPFAMRFDGRDGWGLTEDDHKRMQAQQRGLMQLQQANKPVAVQTDEGIILMDRAEAEELRRQVLRQQEGEGIASGGMLGQVKQVEQRETMLLKSRGAASEIGPQSGVAQIDNGKAIAD